MYIFGECIAIPIKHLVIIPIKHINNLLSTIKSFNLFCNSIGKKHENINTTFENEEIEQVKVTNILGG